MVPENQEKKPLLKFIYIVPFVRVLVTVTDVFCITCKVFNRMFLLIQKRQADVAFIFPLVFKIYFSLVCSNVNLGTSFDLRYMQDGVLQAFTL